MAIILLSVGLIDFDPVMVCLWCKSVLRIILVLLSNRTSICTACGLHRLHPMDSLSCHLAPNILIINIRSLRRLPYAGLIPSSKVNLLRSAM